jgi:hypothetical protein
MNRFKLSRLTRLLRPWPWLVMIVTFDIIALLWPRDAATAVQNSLERSEHSVFLVVAEFGLRQEKRVVFRQVATGTCFRVGARQLVSNRHVFCPWTIGTVPDQIQQAIDENRQTGPGVSFFWRLWIYPNGAEVYRSREHFSDWLDEVTLEQCYYPPLWRTDGPAPSLRLAGAVYNGQKPKIVDDIAVLEIITAGKPEKFPPLKLDHSSLKILQPVATLGYPLAGKYESVCACAAGSGGSVRRVSDKNFLDLDLLSHPGNSGGPVLDANGRAVGVVYGNMALRNKGGVFPLPPPEHRVTFAIPASDVENFLWKLDTKSPVWEGLPALDFKARVTESLRLFWQGKSSQAYSHFFWTATCRSDPEFLAVAALFCGFNRGPAAALLSCRQSLAVYPEDKHARFIWLLLAAHDPNANLRQVAEPLLQLNELSGRREQFYHDAAVLLSDPEPSPAELPEDADARWEKSMSAFVQYLAQLRAAHQKDAVRELLEAWQAADLTEEDSILIAGELDLLRARRWISGEWRTAAPARFEKDLATGLVN